MMSDTGTYGPGGLFFDTIHLTMSISGLGGFVYQPEFLCFFIIDRWISIYVNKGIFRIYC